MDELSLFGNYEHSIDNKFRIKIPSVFSRQLEKGQKLILSEVEVLSYPLIAVFPSISICKNVMPFYLKTEGNTMEYDYKLSYFLRTLYMDKCNRISLGGKPNFLEDDIVTIVGRGNWFEFWEPKTFSKYGQDIIKSLRK